MNAMMSMGLRAAPAGLALGAALLLAACGSTTTTSPPKQVRTETPSVTYKYMGDQELISANQKAVAYCNQFNAVPSTQTISETSDSMKQVVFDCVPRSPTTTPPASYMPGTTTPFRNDQDLIQASRNADLYCRNQGNQRAVSTVVTNSDGTKSLSSHCAP